MSSLVRLLIIDEVHLLNDDRGPIIETLVSRTLRLVCSRFPQCLSRYPDAGQTLSGSVDHYSVL
jgi:superfamily II helicase